MTLPVGTTLDETTAVVKQFQHIIESEIEGYKTLITTVGSGGRSGSSYSGSIQIQLPESDKQIDNDVTIQNKLRKHFADFTDVTFSFGQGMGRQMTGDDLDIAIRSSSLDNALEVAKKCLT